MSEVFTLLVVYQLKHFICDFPLQGKFMLGKFKADWSFLPPLIAHAATHALFTSLIALYFADAKTAVAVSVFDFVIHFFMDRIKAGPKYLGRFKDMYHKYFWWSLGLDQMVHHLTHYVIIYVLVTKGVV